MNEVNLVGRLTRDTEIRYIATSQTAVCTFTIAVDRPPSRDGQNNGPTADFIRITVFGKAGENCSKFLSKGREVALNGRIQTGSYKDKDGKTVYTTDVIANRVEFIGRSNGGQNNQKNVNEDVQQVYEGFERIDDGDVPF